MIKLPVYIVKSICSFKFAKDSKLSLVIKRFHGYATVNGDVNRSPSENAHRDNEVFVYRIGTFRRLRDDAL